MQQVQVETKTPRPMKRGVGLVRLERAPLPLYRPPKNKFEDTNKFN
jgi:hypothetical protein